MMMGPQHRKESRPSVSLSDTDVLTKEVRERGEVSRALLERLPTITEIVVTTDRNLRVEIRRRITECENALAAEEHVMQAFRKVAPPSESRKLSHEFERRLEYVKDLSTRAEALFVYTDQVPVNVPVTSKAQVVELVTGLHRYREGFWRALVEVPGVQRLVLEQLRTVCDGEVRPSAILHCASVGEPNEKALRKEVSEVVAGVDALMARKPRAHERASRLSAIASLLMRTPLDAEDLSELALALRSKANELAELEIALKCDHRGLRSPAAIADPRFASWREGAADFGGGAMVARTVVARIEKAREPYVRIKQYLTTANFPFVQKLVGQHRRYQSLTGDMMQEGAMGFMRALEKFDLKSGFALLTYAGFWVKQRALRGYERQAGVIYVPSRLRSPLAKLSEEISGALGANPAALAKKIGVKPTEIEALRPFTQRAVSLDSTIHGSNMALGDTISSRGIHEVEVDEHRHDRESYRERLAVALRTLRPREQDILIKRFGLDGKGERTLEVVAREMGVTKERIRQLQNRALEYLQAGPAGREMKRLAEDMEQ